MGRPEAEWPDSKFTARRFASGGSTELWLVVRPGRESADLATAVRLGCQVFRFWFGEERRLGVAFLHHAFPVMRSGLH